MRTHRSLAEIQQAYPHPSSDYDRDDHMRAGTYCVGLAIMLAHDAWDHADTSFPGEGELAHCLADLNPALDIAGLDYTGAAADIDVEDTVAYVFAAAITTANDRGDFATAWALAGQALAYQAGAPLPDDE